MFWQPRFYQPQGLYWRKPQGAAAAAAYVFRASATTDNGTDTFTASIDIGTASADRLVIVGALCQNSKVLASASAAGTGLTIHIQASGAAIASAIVASGSGAQTISLVHTGSEFNTRGLFVWTATGLASSTPKDTATGTSSADISVDAGDFMFVAARATANPSFSTSDEAPDGAHEDAKNSLFFEGDDWTINGTDANFTITMSGDSAPWAAANFA